MCKKKKRKKKDAAQGNIQSQLRRSSGLPLARKPFSNESSIIPTKSIFLGRATFASNETLRPR
jgi:hypothetical protein